MPNFPNLPPFTEEGDVRRLLPGVDRAAGRSGLGLEAQRKSVRDHLNGGNGKIVAEFTEVESGKRSAAAHRGARGLPAWQSLSSRSLTASPVTSRSSATSWKPESISLQRTFRKRTGSRFTF